MFLTLRLPHLDLRAACRSDPALWSRPLALADSHQSRNKANLTACNPTAEAYQLHPGLSIARALARCPDLQILPSCEEAAQQIGESLLEIAQSLSPDLELTAPGTITLARADPLPLNCQHLDGLPLQYAFADTPDTAHLRAIAHPHEPATCELLLLLQSFPRLFDSSAQLRSLYQTLATWGLRTIADFSELPRSDLQERLGLQAAILHDISTGKHERLLSLHRPPRDYRLHLELDYGVETLPLLILVIRNLLNTLCARMQSHHRVPGNLLLELHFDDGTSHQSQIRIPEPTTEIEKLLPILEAHLDGLTAPSPVVGLMLDAQPIKPTRSQSDLFRRSLRDPNQFAQTLNQLSAILGPNQLGVPRRLDTYRPDHFDFLPPEELFSPERNPPRRDSSESLLSPPLRRLRPPDSIQVLTSAHQVPEAILTGPHPGPLSEVAGPYPQSGHWWQEDLRWARKEWDTRLHNGPLARLAHIPPHEWRIEGYY